MAIIQAVVFLQLIYLLIHTTIISNKQVGLNQQTGKMMNVHFLLFRFTHPSRPYTSDVASIPCVHALIHV